MNVTSDTCAFTSLYSIVSKVSTVIGFCFPGASKLQNPWMKSVVQIYSAFSTIPLIFIVICNCIVLYKTDMYDIKFHGMNSLVLVTIFDSFYYLLYMDDYRVLLNNFDDLTKSLLTSSLIQNGDIKLILNKIKRFSSHTKCCFLLVFIQISSNGAYMLGAHFLFSQNNIFLDVPYTVDSQQIFLVTAVLQVVAGLFACTKMVCSLIVMFLLLYHVALYLKALSKVFNDCFTDFMTIGENNQKGVKKLSKSLSRKNLIHLTRQNIMLPDEMNIVTDNASNNIYAPVSYTHLDVYKRQR